jgi:hypothetical protein
MRRGYSYVKRGIKMIVFGIFGGKKQAGDTEIEHILNEMSIRDGKIIERDDMKYVKSMNLDREGKKIDAVMSELQKGNVVILNVREISHNKLLLREVVKNMRDACNGINGDLARLSEEKIILLPGGMKISQAESA